MIRLIRLLRLFKELWLLIAVIGKSMNALFWVGFFIFCAGSRKQLPEWPRQQQVDARF